MHLYLDYNTTMNRNNIILLSVVGFFAIIFFWGCNKYNGIIKQDENVKNAWGNVQTQYQRRADLIPALIRTVQEAGKNEKSILESVTKARAGITEAKDEISNAKTPQDLERANAKISSAFTLAVEAYPQVRSTEAYLKLQDEMPGTENRIATARSDYNNSVRAYNVAIRTFPGNIVAGFGGFTVKDEFKAEAGSEKAPDYDKAWDKGKE